MPRANVEASWSQADWVVLGLLIERPRHGFALTKELTPDTLLGQIWPIANPVVYRSLRALQAKEMIRPSASEASTTGPRRTPMQATAAGERRMRSWLAEPVERSRDVQVLLRLKLHLTVRLGIDARPLLTAQRARFAALGASAIRPIPAGTTVERELMQAWRDETYAAYVGFIDRALDALEAQGTAGGVAG